MRHRKRSSKLGRSPEHRKALVASLVCNLIDHKRILTTLAKAKLARRVAERMVTIARAGTLAARRSVLSALRQEKHVTRLFDEIVTQFEGRHGGYTRIVKIGSRASDSSEMVLLEWVGIKPRERRKKKKTDTPDKPA
jgi:large subunit ribosomal protein L17